MNALFITLKHRVLTKTVVFSNTSQKYDYNAFGI